MSDSLPAEIFTAMAAASTATLEEARATRKEQRDDLRDLKRDVASFKSDLAAMRSEINPALISYQRHLDTLEQRHTEALGEAQDARLQLKTTIYGGLTSKPALALWGALGTALAGYAAHALGVL